MSDLFKIPPDDGNLRKKEAKNRKKYSLSDLHRDYEKKQMNILVSSPCYDNAGKVLSSLNLEYKPYAGKLDCNFFFLNCGTSDHVSPQQIKNFVLDGGCLYASDLTIDIINRAFPGNFEFRFTGKKQNIKARVLSEDLSAIIGDTIDIYFDMAEWAILDKAPKSKVILASKTTGKPIMVEQHIGKGKIFYTCFHNHVQGSRAEQILMQLVILKQIGTHMGHSLEKIAENSGLSLPDMRDEMLRLKGK